MNFYFFLILIKNKFFFQLFQKKKMTRRYTDIRQVLIKIINHDPAFQKFEVTRTDKQSKADVLKYRNQYSIDQMIRDEERKRMEDIDNLSDQDLIDSALIDSKQRLKRLKYENELYKNKRYSTDGRSKKSKAMIAKNNNKKSTKITVTKKPDIFDGSKPLTEQPFCIVKHDDIKKGPNISTKLADSMISMRDHGKHNNFYIVFNSAKTFGAPPVLKKRDAVLSELLNAMHAHSRKMEDLMLRTKKYPWERNCSQGHQCRGYLQYEDILVEFLEPEIIEQMKDKTPDYIDKLVPEIGLCLRCMRYGVQIFLIQIKAECCYVGSIALISEYYNIVNKKGEYDIYECNMTNKLDYYALPFPVVGEFPKKYTREVREDAIYHVQTGYRYPEEDCPNPFFA